MSTYKDKTVLLYGLGLLGGGVATAKWLIGQGAKLIIVDAKTKDQLKSSIDKIDNQVQYFLGGRQPSLAGIDFLVLNPGISSKDPFVSEARKQKIPVVNEATIFYNNFKGKIIGITGTRGKTTTVNWTHHLIPDSILCGNSPDHPFLKAIEASEANEAVRWAVTEISSFHLELFDASVRPPDIAILTNIYRDHLNRYDSMEEYAETKKNLYRWQKPASQRGEPGQILIDANEEVPIDLTDFEKQWGTHNVANFRLAALAAHHAGVSWDDIKSRMSTLPQIPYRQQTVFENEHIKIINDSNATSPEAGIAAMERFGGPDTVLIAGGTDKNLDFTTWNSAVKKYIAPDHLVLLNGSATKKMSGGKIYETLEECLQAALSLKPKIILFSPCSSSFEKFTNEYDRGQKFNELVNLFANKP